MCALKNASGLRTATTLKEETTVSKLVSALKHCTKSRDVETGKKLHQHAVVCGFCADKYVVSMLITMYGKCGRVQLAHEVFDGVARPDTVIWNSLILGYVENGESRIAMALFAVMDSARDAFTYVAAIKACGNVAEKNSDKRLSLANGKRLHEDIKASGFDTDVVLSTALIDMYSKCGDMQSAREVFDRTSNRNVVTWTSLILGYVNNGDCDEALNLFNCMDSEPDSFTYVAVLKACAGLAAEKDSASSICLEKGICIHSRIKERGYDSNVVLGTSLVDMYSKCGEMELALEVFYKMKHRNVFTWTSLLLGYLRNGECLTAVDIFTSMDCEPTSVTYVALLKACGCLASERKLQRKFLLEKGIGVHKMVVEKGLNRDLVLENALIDMYRRCGSLTHARQVFNGMHRRDVVSWNSVILGCVENGASMEALELLFTMDLEPDSFTYVAGIQACGEVSTEHGFEREFSLEKGVKLHKAVKELRLESVTIVSNSLLSMYCNCGAMQFAGEVFRGLAAKDVVTWTTLMLGYVENGESSLAMELFDSMDCEPDTLTYVAALKACRCLASDNSSMKESCLKKGTSIHRRVKELGLESHILVATNLLEMYSSCGSMRLAKEVFDGMSHRNAVTWTSLILGYVDSGQSLVAMNLFFSMDCEADALTYVAGFKACGRSGALRAGKVIHSKVCQLGLEHNRVVGNTLMDFYINCGNLKRAQELFDGLQSPDVVSWNILIAGYSSLGDASRVFSLAEGMQEAGLELNGITFTSILTACSHTGLVEEAKTYFKSMIKYGIRSTVEQYNCMVDMLGRANRLHEALELIKSMQVEANGVTWTSLLFGCRKWKDVEVGRVAFDALVALGTNQAAAYVLMSNIYASLSLPRWRTDRTLQLHGSSSHALRVM